jgi:hypothetical protein
MSYICTILVIFLNVCNCQGRKDVERKIYVLTFYVSSKYWQNTPDDGPLKGQNMSG